MGFNMLGRNFDDNEFDQGFEPDFSEYDHIDVEETAFDPDITMGSDDDDDLIELSQDVNAWCSRCGITCPHTVVSRKENVIKQVLCNSCGDEHTYRPTDARSARAAKKQKAARVVDWATFAGNTDQSTVRTYSIKDAYQEGDPLIHPVFGLGLVINLKTANKMEVLFEAGIKRLVCNR